MEESECLCEGHIWALETRILYIEQLLDCILEQLETKRNVVPHCRINVLSFASSASGTIVLGQPGTSSAISLHAAAVQGDVLALVRALCKGDDLAATDLFGDTALHCAVRSDSTLAVELLLATGAPVDAQNHDGATSLAVAAYRGHYDIVEVLLKKGAFIDALDKDGRTPLMRAVVQRNVKIVALLVKKGALVNTIDRYGHSPLVTASRNCLLEILDVLMQSAIAPSHVLRALPIASSSAIFMRLIKGAPTVTMCSLKCAYLTRVAKKGWEQPVHALLTSCVNVQCHSRHLEKVCQALKVASTENILLALWSTSPMDTRKFALKTAASKGWVVALKRILQHWRKYPAEKDSEHLAEVDQALLVADSEAAVHLLLAELTSAMEALAGHDDLWHAVEHGWSAMLLLLIDRGAPADLVRQDGTTLLHRAAARGHVTCVKELIKNGALTSRTDDDGWTPLHLAAEGGHEHVVEALLAAGADPSVKDPFGLTPCDVASSSIVGKMLRNHGKSST